MTIAVGIRTPIGAGRPLLESLKGTPLSPPPPGVVVLTDSRFTLPNGALAGDDAAKLWFPQPGVICTFSGMASIAELAYSRARRDFERAERRHFDEALFVVRDAIQHTIRNVLRRPEQRQNPQFWGLAGIALRDGRAEVHVFSKDNDFEGAPLEPDEDCAFVGNPAAGDRFKVLFQAELVREPEPGQGKSPLVTTVDVMGTAGAVLKQVIEEIGGDIGGPIQLATATREGTRFYQLYRGNSQDPATLTGFDQVSAGYLELNSADRGRNRYRIPQPHKVRRD